MIKKPTPPPAAHPDPAALIAAVLAALVLLVSGRIASQQADVRGQAEGSRRCRRIFLQAGAAVRGSAPAFDALAESQAQGGRAGEIESGRGASDGLTSPGAGLLGSETDGRHSSSRRRPSSTAPGCARCAARRGGGARDHAAIAGCGRQRADDGGSGSHRRPRPSPGTLRAARPGCRAGPLGTSGRHGPRRVGRPATVGQPWIHGH
jgi:hypothetical protein